MPKTLPQLVKIDRADPDRVEPHLEPYNWQKAQQSGSAKPATPESWEVPTVRLPKNSADALARRKPR